MPVGHSVLKSSSAEQESSTETAVIQCFPLPHATIAFLLRTGMLKPALPNSTAAVSSFPQSVTDKVFLEFFFARLRPNTTGRYDEEFPYLSLCGRERNFVRCDDRPIVFLDLVQRAEISHWLLTFGFAQSSKLSVPFQPQHLYMNPNSGRIYHPTINFDDPEKNTVHESLVVGLMCSDLALRLADMFEWTQLNHADTGAPPDHFLWEQTVYKLSNALSPYIAST
ncbi:UPF0598 protein CG30010 [Clonorchis sinensis]|uniref:UPF0598 protein CG30010 n=1 Tax=Clonorchis sinensis TaxID=79923 RepID=G7YSV6_CLOSI|nr:UPF0598 protein CG30010 [Clonorchis sinensis]